MTRIRPASDRFFEKIEKTPTGCWLWTGARKEGNLYGFFYDDGKVRLAHRWSYAHFKGPIPDGLFVCHRCDNPPCVNPDHLFLGTNSENLIDYIEKGFRPSPEKCPQGHLYGPADFRIRDGRENKKCSICERDRDRKRKNDPRRKAYMKLYNRDWLRQKRAKAKS